MTTHKHQTILRGAAEELKRNGYIRTYDAVYRWVCPDCGHPDRTTRLADTMYALRHAYGWVITTHAETDQLAVYTLVKAGDMPGESNGPHPRQLVRDHIDAVVDPERFPYSNAAEQIHHTDHISTLDSRTDVQLESVAATGYSPYEGKRVPVEAIPFGRWECTACGFETTDPIGQPQLGGYRLARCPSKQCNKLKSERIFRPVR
jgi:rubrerythrin